LAQSGAKDKKRHISVVLRILVAAGALYLVFRGEDIGRLIKVFGGLDWRLFAVALGLFWLGQVFFVLRWRLLSRVQSVDFGLVAGLKLHLLGLFYNNCLPSSVGGDLLRAWYVTKHADEDKRVEAALSVFVDRAVGLTGMFLMVGIAYWLVPVEGGYIPEASGPADGKGSLWAYLVEQRWLFFWIVIVIISGFCATWATRRGRELLTGYCQRFWGLGVRFFKKGLRAVVLYSRKPLVLLYAIGLTFLCQGSCIIGFWLLGRNLGMEAHIKYYFVLFPLSWLLGTLPISIGGIGIMEGLLKVMFMKLGGVTSQQALAVALCQRIIWLIGSAPGLVVHLVGAHLPKEKADFLIDSADDPG